MLLALASCWLSECARPGRLEIVEPVTPVSTEGPADSAQAQREQLFAALFGDTLVGFKPGSADSTDRFLGRLREGYTVDTLNVMLLGDNRPGFRSTHLRPHYKAIEGMVSLNPVNWVKGLINIPILLVRGTIPDFTLWRDIPEKLRAQPSFGREESVLKAMTAAVDSLEARGQKVSAIINTGDLVKDGRFPNQWERFLTMVTPLAKRVPYFPIAGNHERTDSPEGLYNWHTATGLPISSDRLYYYFDSADGWVRFIALDSNPMTDPKNYWTREVEVLYSDEQIDWLTKIMKGHTGPALVFMHHPPFSLGFHRVEWQNDALLRERRARMVKALHESGLSVMAAGHEHAYERALLTCGDAVLIVLVAGGAGSPLHQIPLEAAAAQMFAEYEIEGCEFKPENTFVSQSFHFIHMRFWFGGGDFYTYAVDENGDRKLIDEVKIDLKRFGVPEVDQHKMPVPPETDVEQAPPTEETSDSTAAKQAKPDSAASEHLLESPPPEDAEKKPPAKKRSP